MKKKLKTSFRAPLNTIITAGLALLVLIAGIIVFEKANLYFKNDTSEISHTPQEITAILEVKDKKIQEKLYLQLIKRQGPEEAQEALYRSGLAFDGETHLLNHTVGDWLYEKYDTKGLVYCKDYFLSSCYHGFLIRVIGEGGLENLFPVLDECKKKGYATLIQCSHAIGHGLLAYVGYSYLPQALVECDNVALREKDFPVYNCYDGVFMENNFAVHEAGGPSPDRWFKDDDPTYPCFDDRIAEKYRKACWSNQPQVMYKMFKGDVSKIVPYCEQLVNPEYQSTCFDSIARQLLSETQADVEKTVMSCKRMPVSWQDQCVISIAASFFTIGDRKVPFELCERVGSSKRRECFLRLQGLFKYYILDLPTREYACQFIPPTARDAFCTSIYSSINMTPTGPGE